MKMTAEFLRKHKACAEQVAIFEKEWPGGAEVTVANVLRAIELGLDLEFARKFFTAPALKAYDEAIAPALKALDEATAPALKAYDEAIATARKFFTAPALKALDEAIATARKAYAEATAPARKAYDEATATALKASWEQTFGGAA